MLSGLILVFIGMCISPFLMFFGSKPKILLNFTTSKEIWSDVELWAKEQGYAMKNKTETERFYKKRDGSLILSSCLSIRQDGDTIHVEAWILIIFKKVAIDDMRLMGNSFRRDSATQINKLLMALGSPVMITVRA